MLTLMYALMSHRNEQKSDYQITLINCDNAFLVSEKRSCDSGFHTVAIKDRFIDAREVFFERIGGMSFLLDYVLVGQYIDSARIERILTPDYESLNG